MPGDNEQDGASQYQVQYQSVAADYLQKRSLKKSAGWVLLWALGVGAVISGDFSGWNSGLGQGGFHGLLLATLAMAVMYVCLVFSIAELSSALPHAGGFYSFVRNALGPTWGYVCGVTDTIEYVLTPAAVAVFIGGYMGNLAPAVPSWAWWLLLYGIFVPINVRGAALTLKLGLGITLLAIVVLITFFVAALCCGDFSWEKLHNIPAGPSGTQRGLPFGWLGVFTALPFATWFFLAIEQLPLAAEETHDVVRDMPRALLWSIATLCILALLTLVLNTGVGGGAVAMQSSSAPLADGFRAIFGDGALTKCLTVLALAGLLASFHTIVYAAGRVLFALSRAGYFPRWISVTSRWRTPHRALGIAALAGLACAFTISVDSSSIVGKALLNIAVAGAVVSYVLVLVSFIKLRLSKPELPRPYRSPLGIPGAALGAALASLVLVACFAVEDYRLAMAGVGGFVIIALLYFALYSRRRLVAKAPEEEAALVADAESELAHK